MPPETDKPSVTGSRKGEEHQAEELGSILKASGI